MRKLNRMRLLFPHMVVPLLIYCGSAICCTGQTPAACADAAVILIDTVAFDSSILIDYSASRKAPNTRRVLVPRSLPAKFGSTTYDQLDVGGYLYLSCFEFDVSFSRLSKQLQYESLIRDLRVRCNEGGPCFVKHPAELDHTKNGILTYTLPSGRFLRGLVRTTCLAQMNGWDIKRFKCINGWISFVVPLCD